MNPGWSDYLDRKRGFRLEHPSGWELRPGQAGLLLAVVAPPGQEGGFRSNLNVVRKAGVQSAELDRLAQMAIREVARVLTDLIVIDIDAAVVSDRPARRLLFGYRQGIFGLTAEQWVLGNGDQQWTISAAASSDVYDSVADDFSGIVESFEITDG